MIKQLLIENSKLIAQVSILACIVVMAILRLGYLVIREVKKYL